MKTAIGTLLLAGAFAAPALAQGTATWNGLPGRFEVDAGYFRLGADTQLRFDAPAGRSGEIDFEDELGLEDRVNTFWVDARWRVGRRHQLQLGFTQSSRDRAGLTLDTDFVWGGETYTAGLSVTPETSAKILGGYYRFALFRSERFEVGPTLGVGYLWIDARIRATGTFTGDGGVVDTRSLDESASIGSITGAVGGYAEAWPAKRLVLRGDFLYIRVNPGDSEASVTDWRVAANYYFSRHVGVGVQYKYNQYTYDRGILISKLGGEVTFDGFQVFLTTRF
jgi:hypothetical protein